MMSVAWQLAAAVGTFAIVRLVGGFMDIDFQHLGERLRAMLDPGRSMARMEL